MPVAISQMRVSRKITVNLDQNQLNVRPIIKGKRDKHYAFFL